MLLDLEAFRAVPLTREPFNYTVVTNAVPPAAASAKEENKLFFSVNLLRDIVPLLLT